MGNTDDSVVIDTITVVNQEYVSKGNVPKVTSSDSIRTTGIKQVSVWLAPTGPPGFGTTACRCASTTRPRSEGPGTRGVWI